MSESTKFWERAGIPNADSFQQLLYNEASNLVVARLSRNIQGHPFGILYSRVLEDEKYEALADESDTGVSFNDPVSVAREPYLFVLTMKVAELDGKYIGYDSIGIRKIDLKSRKTVLTMSDSDFVPEPPYSRIWASSIAGHKSGNVLFCSVGMQRSDENRGPVDYFLCAVDVQSRSIERLTHLREVFL